MTIEKERHLKNMLMTIKKRSRSLDDYLKDFKSICDTLAAIKQPVLDHDKVFQFGRVLGPTYDNFQITMLTKPPYPSFTQFVQALQSFEQDQIAKKDEEKAFLEHAQAFFGQRGRGQNNRGGHENFNSRGKGFAPASRSNSRCPLFCQIRFDYSYQFEEIPQALATLSTNDQNDPSFYVDFGATSHMTNDSSKLSYIKPYNGNDVIYVGDGNIFPICEVNINTENGQLNLKDVLVVSDLKKNLLSIGKLTQDNLCTVEFTSTDFVVEDQKQSMIAKGRKRGQLYALNDTSQEVLSAIRKVLSNDTQYHKLYKRHLVTTRNSHRARDNRRDVAIDTNYPECRSKPRKA
ncbi:Uncharacterized protein TCM_044707 [Theobroma cacao]|uniref:Retrovirus-related Pol polyprotein from transposon TNT 1-94-like beta-barrel domain-containing protein n=1 Tax=Theobroma cacao TaxID=3641 RepID=A0A061FXM7_THECC|nr:Uncharacterized protein TCM_044707 [Theobroma cacao]